MDSPEKKFKDSRVAQKKLRKQSELMTERLRRHSDGLDGLPAIDDLSAQWNGGLIEKDELQKLVDDWGVSAEILGIEKSAAPK